MYSLVVIDMQPEFLGRYEEGQRQDIVEAVCDAVKQAVEDGAEIIELLYKPLDPNDPHDILSYGPTVSEIARIWRQHRKVKRVWKENDNGGYEVMDAGIHHDEIRTCGINFSFCVAETVRCLLEHDKDVKIIRDAVANPEGDFYHGYSDSDEMAFANILI